MTKKIITIIMVLLTLLTPVISIAATESELTNKKNNLQNSINEAKDRQNEIEGEVKATQTELDKINDEISEKEYEIEKVTEELNQLNQEVAELTVKLQEATEKYDTQYDTLCKRLVAQYKRGSVSYLDVLLNSSSLTDFISNYYIIEKIAEMDTKLLNDIEEQKRTIEVSKKEVEQKKNQVADKQAQLKLDESILSNKKENKKKYISQLSAEEQQLEKEIEELNEQMKQTDRELQLLAMQASGGSTYKGGKLEWPVVGNSRISSYFGYRGSAATGGVGTANHNGYDIAAAHNLPVVAAEAGQVIKVVNACPHDYPKTVKNKCNCGGGYGNYIMISHGGIVTLYGHVATGSIKVKVGDTVTRGQTIAGVGSCGWSTGYHLHFSVITSAGQYVDPGNYFSK